jgi:hypothetical protein
VAEQEGLETRVKDIIVEEWERRGPFESEIIYNRLMEEGWEVPDYYLRDRLNLFATLFEDDEDEPNMINFTFRRPRSEEANRKHGDILIEKVKPEQFLW